MAKAGQKKRQRQLLKLEAKQTEAQVEVQAQAQKQQQILRQLALYVAMLAAAVGGRAALQGFPSIEPVSALALLAGILFGPKIGFAFGAKAMFLSNFLVFGGQGFWTAFQALGMGIVGFLGGLIRGEITFRKVAVVIALATLVYEIIVNIGWGLSFGALGLLTAFVLSIPFALVHLLSNLGFATMIPGLKRQIDEGKSFSDVCAEFVAKVRQLRLLRR